MEGDVEILKKTIEKLIDWSYELEEWIKSELEIAKEIEKDPIASKIVKTVIAEEMRKTIMLDPLDYNVSSDGYVKVVLPLKDVLRTAIDKATEMYKRMLEELKAEI